MPGLRQSTVISAGLLAAVLLHASEPATAARRPITGTLSQPGYTVIALADSGKARSVRASTRPFRLVPPADRVTLHLRASSGKYAGPIVVGARRGGAVVGVRAGARLGRIAVLADHGRARAGRFAVGSRLARARRGVPIGAGVFGRVRSRPPRGAPRTDRDLDGVPNPLDVDDDGDLVLDSLDRSTRARTAQAPAQTFDFEHNLAADLHETVNANAAGLTAAQMDAFLAARGTLLFGPPPGDSVELDCGVAQSRTNPLLGGLSYCSRGGTGRRFRPSTQTDAGAFPECCDPDGDGLGSLTEGLIIRHGATTAQIGTGDVMIERVTTNGVETQFAAVLQYVPATVPALVSYSDGRGNSATLSYPVAGPPGPHCAPACPPQGPGTRENPFPVRSGAGGDVVLTLTFWRPQRRPIPPEASEWVDIGRLVYEAEGPGGDCPQSTFSTADPNLSPAPFNSETGGLADSAPDRPASPANTLTYRLDTSKCLGSEAWSPGQTKQFNLRGTDRTGYAAQSVFFKRQ